MLEAHSVRIAGCCNDEGRGLPTTGAFLSKIPAISIYCNPLYLGPVWQGSGSSKNGSGSGSSGGVASLVKLSHFKKRLAK
jgi:hypothetical protein